MVGGVKTFPARPAFENGVSVGGVNLISKLGPSIFGVRVSPQLLLIIVALIAIAAIGVVTVFGRDIRELFSATTDSLAGNQAVNPATKKATVKTKTIKTFGKYNAAGGD